MSSEMKERGRRRLPYWASIRLSLPPLLKVVGRTPVYDGPECSSH